MSTYENPSMEEMLEHHGIIGMKWGVRRYQNEDGTLTNAGKARYRDDEKPTRKSVHDDHTKARDKKKVSEMSDKELRDRLNRLDMERRYHQLNPGTVSKGKDYLNKTIKVGTTVATVTTTALTIYNNYNKIAEILNKRKG